MFLRKLTSFLLAAFLVAVAYLSISGKNMEDPPSPPFDKNEAVFEKVMSVITHKRCMNCHPSDDYPRQGEDSHLHRFGVQRGPENHGLTALQCGTCHQTANNNFSGVPGAPHWGLAPKSMGWQGLNKYEIAEAMLDRNKNGNRSLKDIEHHLTQDPLVLWVFEPGINNEGTPREKPPLNKEEWISAVTEWVEAGAPIPSKD